MLFDCNIILQIISTAAVCNHSSVKNKTQFQPLRTGPAAAKDAQDRPNVLPKMTLLTFQDTLPTFYRTGGQVCHLPTSNFLTIPRAKIIKFGSFLTNNTVAFFEHGSC